MLRSLKLSQKKARKILKRPLFPRIVAKRQPGHGTLTMKMRPISMQ